MNRKKLLLLLLLFFTYQSVKSSVLLFILSGAAFVTTWEITQYISQKISKSSDDLLNYEQSKQKIKQLQKELIKANIEYGAKLYEQQKSDENSQAEAQWKKFKEFTKSDSFKKLTHKHPKELNNLFDTKGRLDEDEIEKIQVSLSEIELEQKVKELEQKLNECLENHKKIKESLPEEYIIISNARKKQKEGRRDLLEFRKSIGEEDKKQGYVIVNGKPIAVAKIDQDILEQDMAIFGLKKQLNNLIKQEYNAQANLALLAYQHIAQPTAIILSGIDQKQIQQQKHEAMLASKSHIGIPHLVDNDNE